MSGEGLRAIPVWDSNNNFVALSSTEALNVLEHFVDSKNNMLKLTSTDETMRTVSALLDGHAMKTELMAYLLRRLGVNTPLPIPERTVTAISEHISKIGSETDSGAVKKAVMNEFQILARITSPGISNDRKLALVKGASKRQDMSPFGPKALTGV